MRPDQTEGIDEARRTDMSNEIYPLEKETGDGLVHPLGELSVNKRLAPIFRALADDPEGWEIERYQGSLGNSGAWGPTTRWPTTHEDCNNFRLVPKRRTITVETLKPVSVHLGLNATGLVLVFSSYDEALEAKRVIREAMEGK